MSRIDVDKMLAVLHWYVARNIRLRGIAAEGRILEGTERRPVRLSIEFPNLGWSALCDREGLEIVHADFHKRCRWQELDPDVIYMDAETGQRALYQDAEVLLKVEFVPGGSWKEILAPGLFILWLWNSAY